MAESYKLTYFNMRGLGEPARLIFAYAGVDYEDNRIEQEEWPPLKENYPWGQLPMLEVGGETLSQSTAIFRYLAKKYDLAGEDDWEAAKMDEYADALNDFRNEWRKQLFEQDETRKAEFQKNFYEVTAPKYLSSYEAILTSNGAYLVGKKLSWIDITLAHFLEFFELLAPNLLDNYPELKKLKETVFQIPQIKAWIKKRPVTQM